MKKIYRKGFLFFTGLMLVIFAVACQPAENNTNTNLSNANTNMNLNSNVNTNTNSMNTNTMSVIDTKEPDQYQATVSLTFETSGSNAAATPPLKAEVARNGEDRKMEFALTGGERFIYLTKDGKQYLISPNRKQIAELNKEALGFDLRNMMMPEQIVNQVKNLQGVEMVGEEKVDGRDAIRYNYGSKTDTQTKAGEVTTESFILVDKATGLPLRSVTDASSQQGNVQGVSGIKFITQINNIRETAEPTLFEVPTGSKEVQPEEIRQQMNTLLSAAMAILGQIMKSAQPNQAPAATPTP
jgi:hypothetical protein